MESILGLKGKVVFITGSSRGIGWATAQAFASQGAITLLNGFSDRASLEAKASELSRTYDVQTEAIFFDVTNPLEIRQCYQSIFKKFGRLDVLVNNAGVMQDSFLGMISDQLIHKVLEVNTVATLLHTQEASRLMGRRKSGSIINLTSIIGTQGAEGQVVYSASKAAVVGITKSAAKELAPKNIRVNAVAPGCIDTDLIGQLPPEKLEATKNSIKMARIGEPKDVANTILFLASDLSTYVTGQVIGVDGGMLI